MPAAKAKPAASSSDDSEDSRPRVGDRVRVVWGPDIRYAGTIADTDTVISSRGTGLDRRFLVQYDDGDTRWEVERDANFTIVQRAAGGRGTLGAAGPSTGKRGGPRSSAWKPGDYAEQAQRDAYLDRKTAGRLPRRKEPVADEELAGLGKKDEGQRRAGPNGSQLLVSGGRTFVIEDID